MSKILLTDLADRADKRKPNDMEVSLDEVKEILQKLLNEEISRESANDWSYRLMQEADADTLTYNPKKSGPVIWKAIMFIMGLDLKIQPDVYFHNKDDIREYLEKISN